MKVKASIVITEDGLILPHFYPKYDHEDGEHRTVKVLVEYLRALRETEGEQNDAA